MVSIKQSKFIKSLKIKKYRLREKCFLIEGKKNVLEGITSDCKLRYILGTKDFISSNQTILNSNDFDVIEVASNVLTELGTFKMNNECLAVAEMFEDKIEEVSFRENIVVLDGVSDPGNLGTIIRTLDWFGMTQLVCSTDSADLYNPKVINATMGSFTRVKVNYVDLPEFIESSPLKAYGADLEGKILHQWKSHDPILLVMGSESHGISTEVQELLSDRLTIQKIGEAESLNVAIATGIFCQHLKFMNA
ncbi:MAG: RNA methyltransferase [Cyclobacteriaceae bacterium]